MVSTDLAANGAKMLRDRPRHAIFPRCARLTPANHGAWSEQRDVGRGAGIEFDAVLFHPWKGCVLRNRLKLLVCWPGSDEVCDSLNRPMVVPLHVGKVQEENVRPVAQRPPRLHEHELYRNY